MSYEEYTKNIMDAYNWGLELGKKAAEEEYGRNK